MSNGTRLIVADDEDELRALMKDALEMEGYSVDTACNGQEALEMVRENPPDALICDLWMPIKTGFDVCKELKSENRFHHMPIIILSAHGTSDNKIQGLDSGADDFLTKPIDLSELLARIRMIIRRTRQGLDANPLTHLPGNVSIQNRINQSIARKEPLAVLYCDLNNFKAYNDIYGYDAGDRVIVATAQVISGVVQKIGNHDFIGHIGGDDFIVVTHPDNMEAFGKEICSDFSALAPTFYEEEDRSRGKIVAKDRQGNTVEYPLLSIAVGISHNKLRPLTSFAQVSSIGAETKKVAKGQGGSSYFVDRRKSLMWFKAIGYVLSALLIIRACIGAIFHDALIAWMKTTLDQPVRPRLYDWTIIILFVFVELVAYAAWYHYVAYGWVIVLFAAISGVKAVALLIFWEAASKWSLKFLERHGDSIWLEGASLGLGLTLFMVTHFVY